MAEGVDYAGDPPDPRQLAAAGKRFVIRYGGPGGDWKHLDQAEARALTGAGLALVANAEGAADGLRGGWDAGVSWARSADQHFRALGMPPGRPIYLSVDWDVAASEWPAVAQALRGAASVLGAARVGVYGGRRAIEWARRDNVARWFWQTFAWSAGVWVKGNHIEQYRNGVLLAGGTVDLNRSLISDFGQWTLGASGGEGLMSVEGDKIIGMILDGVSPTGNQTIPAPGGGSRPRIALYAAIADMQAQLAAAEAREIARDAAQSELIRQVLAVIGNPLSPEQFAQLRADVRAAAVEAGADARDRVLAELVRQEQEREAALRAALAAEAPTAE